jgi:NAD(P)-dependent dehydrogenase (short-subunit alcohol dehydrogenase family)
VLQGCVALVTGGTTGIRFGSAKRLLEHEVHIICELRCETANRNESANWPSCSRSRPA